MATTVEINTDIEKDMLHQDYVEMIEKEEAKAKERGDTIHELRDSFVPEAKGSYVLTNHFSLQLGEKKALNQFEIIGMDVNVASTNNNSEAAPPTNQQPRATESTPVQSQSRTKALPRGQKELLFNKLVERCPTLRQNRLDYATDGMRYIVTWENLLDKFKEDRKDSEEIDVNERDVVFQATFDLRKASKPDPSRYPEQKRTLKIVDRGRVLVSTLKDASEGREPHFKVTPAEPVTGMSTEHALNLIIAKAARASPKSMFRIGSNKVFLDDDVMDLSPEPGIVAYKGFFSTVKVGMGRPLLNVSLATSAFHKPMALADYIQEMGNDNKKAIGRKVTICYTPDRIKTVQDFGRCPREQTFTIKESEEEREISVLDYLKRNPAIDLGLLERIALSNLSCVNARSADNPEWYPMEVLSIAKHQPCGGRLPPRATERMIAVARMSPSDSLERVIKHGLQLLGTQFQELQQSTLSKASINISRKVLKIPARKLDEPQIEYGNAEKRVTIDGVEGRWQWDLQNKTFYTTAKSLSLPFLVLRCDGVNNYKAHDFASRLYQQMHTLGIKTRGQPGELYHCEPLLYANGQNAFENKIEKLVKSHRPQLLVFINDDKDAAVFDNLKRVCEQKHGLQNICITRKKIDGIISDANKNANQYFANVAMKVNLKLGNTNHAVRLPRNSDLLDGVKLSNTIILGADVTHPGKGATEDSRSLAALVGSVDGDLGQFYGSVTHQKRNKEGIDPVELEKMAYQRFEAFYNNSSPCVLPENILYYRDGVDAGQYESVRKLEVEAVRSAFKSFAKAKHLSERSVPKVTVVIVTKRHHTRFYPTDEGKKDTKGNCLPGTCVDSGVTHPNYFDFYLLSHKAVAGTARPTYYVVLENDMQLSPKALQDFTYWLCYSYVRATVPLGYAPPAYYADRLCERARCYFSDFLKPATKPRTQPKDKDADNDEKDEPSLEWMARWNTPNNPHGPWHTELNDTMFWM
ncbi:hypothetical protein SLS60_006056 [Paraconiothyrium brasiliense]|uniref:Piwi domain-containing protein n=1 Tax=Paraconiothyrium brasiliense TaxID=300254 RepID=A0ABR3RET7_9PLEO